MTSRRPILIAFLVVGTLCVIGLARQWFGPAAPPMAVVWNRDFSAAQAQAAESGKPLLVLFRANWCGACRSMERTTWSDGAVARAARPYVPIIVDVDDHRELARRYNVEALPTVALLRPDGTVARASVGYASADEMVNWLTSR